jgi:hypothetical protein
MPFLRKPTVSFDRLGPVLKSPASLRQAQGERPYLYGTNSWIIDRLTTNNDGERLR